MRYVILICVFCLATLMGFLAPAHADFMVSSAIIEFTSDGAKQKDIELISRSKENDYIVAEINEVINPNAPNESRKLIEDATEGGLLVTPDKTILAAGSSRLLRFVLTRDFDDKEHIYRVAVKPVIKGVDNKTKVGLKILVGYEVLVIVRPNKMVVNYSAKRNGKNFTVTNNGNTNVLFENGQQCTQEENCAKPPVVRVYPGETRTVELPQDKPIDYLVWDGTDSATKNYH